MSGPLRFGADELGPTEGTELDDALEAVLALEAVAEDVPVKAGPAFTDRVMAALAEEPSPAPAGFLVPIRRRGLLAGFAESVREAWASIGAGRPALARAAALAYVLVVAIAGTSLAGAATVGAAGALGLLEPHASITPSPEPTPAPFTTPEPTESDEPSAEPSESPEPAETQGAEPSDDHGGAPRVEPSDNHSGGSGSDDGSGSGGGGSDDGSSGSGGSSPQETDDHSGSGGGTSVDE